MVNKLSVANITHFQIHNIDYVENVPFFMIN